MSGRLAGKFAVVVGAGQTPGETIGNGHAIAELFSREGAQVLCVDRVLDRAEETAAAIGKAGGQAQAMSADISKAADCERVVDEAKARFGRLDILATTSASAAATLRRTGWRRRPSTASWR